MEICFSNIIKLNPGTFNIMENVHTGLISLPVNTLNEPEQGAEDQKGGEIVCQVRENFLGF